jgi:hypothetical protein
MVNDSLEAILIVHENVQKMKNLDGLRSSLNLLPDSLTSPYPPPLGN